MSAGFINRNARGLGFVAAIFFITVVALLTVALTRSVATSARASADDVQRLKALLAAETGAQLGAHGALPPSGAPQCASRTVSLDAFGLPQCEADIACRFETVTGIRYYTIESDGTCMDGPNVAAHRTVVLRLRGL